MMTTLSWLLQISKYVVTDPFIQFRVSVDLQSRCNKFCMTKY